VEDHPTRHSAQKNYTGLLLAFGRVRLNKSIVPVAVVALIIGLAFGMVVFPRTTTLTTTQTTTMTQMTTYQVIMSTTGNSSAEVSYPVVTFTVVTVLVYFFQGECTTVSGTPSVTYTNGPVGQLTMVTTVYHTSLPGQFSATITTELIGSYSFITEPFAGSC
jgi:hypothetical protein